MLVIGLREELKQHFKDHDATFYEKISDVEFPAQDTVFVDSTSVDYLTLLDKGEVAQGFYLMDAINPSQAATVKSVGYQIITLDQLNDILHPHNKESRVITFWGVLPGLGTTTIATSVASYMSDKLNVRVCVLQLNLYDPSTWFFDNVTHYLDDIKPYLEEFQLTPDLLQSNLIELPNAAFYLPGCRSQLIAQEFHPTEIRHLIDVAKDMFDYVILDIGSVLDQPGAIEALQAGRIFAVLTDRVAAQRRFHEQHQTVLQPLFDIYPQDISIIGSRMTNRDRRTLHAFAQATGGTTPIASIEEMTQVMRLNEQQNNPIREFLDTKAVAPSIKTIAETLVETHAVQQAAATTQMGV